jgi:hypothetical protein
MYNFFIRDEACLPSVSIGNCQPNQDLDFSPNFIRDPANNEQAMCSPAETKHHIQIFQSCY